MQGSVAAVADATLARVDVLTTCLAAKTHWRRLEAENALQSPYQRYDWAELWQRHVGPALGAEPVIVIGVNSSGHPLFLLPFERLREGRIVIARFFGGKHANINLALWRRDFAQTADAATLISVLERVAADHDIDLFKLTNLPAAWEGIANPLLRLAHERATDDIFQVGIAQRPGTQLLEDLLSPSMRGRLRNKERKIAKYDGYRYIKAATFADVDRHLDAFFEQKARHLAAAGVANVFAQPGIEAFIRAACKDGLQSGRPLIEIHALECKSEVLALFAGVLDQDRYSSMFNSYTLGENARFSPGLILLTHLVRHIADRGLATFDLGVGEAHYKTFFCKDVLALYDSYLPFSMRGRLAVAAARPVNRLKRFIKSTPLAWAAIRAARQRLLAVATKAD
ncbi:MAG: GNAT family N-acetyltransferase [Proteobacteria bacterium]|nr:GNAT family N-acetyltransferase [Pseudomonadota bacterium]